MGYWVYVLECEEEAWYVGYTSQLQERVDRHFSGKGSYYTILYPPKELVFSREYATKSEALFWENWITKALQERTYKVAGGCWFSPSVTGRGVRPSGPGASAIWYAITCGGD